MEKYCKACGRVFKDSDFKICPYCGHELSEREGRQPIPRKLRHQVFQRDNYRCRECGATNKQTRLHVDHIVPVAKGGTNDLSNLQILCEACNKAKYTDEWIGGELKSKRGNEKKNRNTNEVKITADDFSTSKDFINSLRYGQGIFLNCLIPYYGYGTTLKIDILHPTPIERFKKVRILYDGVYVYNVLYHKTLKLKWENILSIEISEKELKINIDEKNYVLIYLPTELEVMGDMQKLIYKITPKDMVVKIKCQMCNNLSNLRYRCSNCGFYFNTGTISQIQEDNFIFHDSNIKPINKELSNSKEFIAKFTNEGVYLYCSAPNYVIDDENNIKIEGKTINQKFKKVKMLDDGIYIENLLQGKQLRMLWNEISSIKMGNTTLKITMDEKNIILIDLPKYVNVMDDIMQIIPKKINIIDKKHDNN